MKICNKCKVPKSTNDFNKRRHGLQPWCKECNKERSKQYYAENRLKHLSEIKKRKRQNQKQNRQRLLDIKAKCICPFCKENDPICFDFHHVGDKELDIAATIRSNWSWDRILEEIKKCAVVCSNCHRKVHAGKLVVTEDMLIPLSFNGRKTGC